MNNSGQSEKERSWYRGVLAIVAFGSVLAWPFVVLVTGQSWTWALPVVYGWVIGYSLSMLFIGWLIWR